MKVYCSVVDMLDDADEDDNATGKAAAKMPVDPKAEEALDAKAEKIIGSLGEDFSDAYYTMAEFVPARLETVCVVWPLKESVPRFSCNAFRPKTLLIEFGMIDD